MGGTGKHYSIIYYIHYFEKKYEQLYFHLLCWIFVDISSQIKLMQTLQAPFQFQLILKSSFLFLVCDILSQSD